MTVLLRCCCPACAAEKELLQLLQLDVEDIASSSTPSCHCRKRSLQKHTTAGAAAAALGSVFQLLRMVKLLQLLELLPKFGLAPHAHVLLWWSRRRVVLLLLLLLLL